MKQNHRNNQSSAKSRGSAVLAHAPNDGGQSYPRDYLENRFVYLVISPQDRGLSIGVNVNQNLKCGLPSWDGGMDRAKPAGGANADVKRMATELHRTIALVQSGRLRQRPPYAHWPEDLLKLRHVAISGDGEPTLSSHFAEALETILHLRVLGGFRFFKIVVVTNSPALDRPKVRHALRCLTSRDEIWLNLDGGTQGYLNKLDGAPIRLKKIMDNILLVGRQRPVIIQSLFPAIHGAPPPPREIKQYAQRLKELKKAGAQISLVQICSAAQRLARNGFSHLPLQSLSRIAKTVRRVAGLRAEVF